MIQYQGAAWDLIFMANKKQQKKFPTKVTKKNKKKFKPFLDTQKNSKKGSQIQCHKKKVITKVAKKIKKTKKGFSNSALTLMNCFKDFFSPV